MSCFHKKKSILCIIPIGLNGIEQVSSLGICEVYLLETTSTTIFIHRPVLMPSQKEISILSRTHLDLQSKMYFSSKTPLLSKCYPLEAIVFSIAHR